MSSPPCDCPASSPCQLNARSKDNQRLTRRCRRADRTRSASSTGKDASGRVPRCRFEERLMIRNLPVAERKTTISCVILRRHKPGSRRRAAPRQCGPCEARGLDSHLPFAFFFTRPICQPAPAGNSDMMGVWPIPGVSTSNHPLAQLLHRGGRSLSQSSRQLSLRVF